MQLMTKELWKRMPRPGSQANKRDPIVVAKFFTPWADWTWYAIEGDPKTGEMFGLVVGLETEFGTFSLEELESVHGPFGLEVERDIYWEPTRLSEVKRMLKNRNR